MARFALRGFSFLSFFRSGGGGGGEVGGGVGEGLPFHFILSKIADYRKYPRECVEKSRTKQPGVEFTRNLDTENYSNFMSVSF